MIGVIDMALLSVIRRWHFREQMPIREIERRTGLSRNTIRKYLRAGTVEPKFRLPKRPSRLDRFAEKLSGWLAIEACKSRKQRRTAKRIHADLVALGFDGSYARVATFIRNWKAERQRVQQTTGRGVFVPLVFQPGEAFQFDSHGEVRVKGRWQIPSLFRYPWSEPKLHDTGRSSGTGSNSHTVAALNGCTNIPHSCGDGSGERDHSGARR